MDASAETVPVASCSPSLNPQTHHSRIHHSQIHLSSRTSPPHFPIDPVPDTNLDPFIFSSSPLTPPLDIPIKPCSNPETSIPCPTPPPLTSPSAAKTQDPEPAPGTPTEYAPPIPTYTVWSSDDGLRHITVGLTYDPLNILHETSKIRSPCAGALVLFLGTTRNTFNNRPVSHLSYSAYPALTLQTLLKIAKQQMEKHGLIGVCIVHRLGVVPIGEESIVVGVSSPHRKAAFEAGEETLEIVKERAEIWKREVFSTGEGVWRANKDSMDCEETKSEIGSEATMPARSVKV